MISLPGQKVEQCPVTAIGRITFRAMAQVSRHCAGLFRPELLIQIFPESDQNFLTEHSPYPFAMSLLAHGWKENSSAAHLVPAALWPGLNGGTAGV